MAAVMTLRIIFYVFALYFILHCVTAQNCGDLTGCSSSPCPSPNCSVTASMCNAEPIPIIPLCACNENSETREFTRCCNMDLKNCNGERWVKVSDGICRPCTSK